jgi:hypothetical protein
VDDSRRPDALVTAVGILLDWERNVEIRAVAIASRQGKSDPVYSKVTAFSDGSFWTIRADEYVAEYDSHTGAVWTYADGRVEKAPPPMNAIPNALWGLLPLRIPMWNRQRDAWRFVSAEWVTGGIRLHLESTANVPGRVGEVFVDTSLGLATHIQLGDVDIRYAEIVGARVRPPRQ